MKRIIPSFWFILKNRVRGNNFLYEFYFRDKKTLDIACGEGRFLKLDKKLIHGFDINEKVIGKLSNDGYLVKMGDVENMPYPDGEFEMARCHNVIEHLVPEKAHKMLAEAGRVLKMNGLLVLSSEVYTLKFWGTFEHVRPYPPGAVAKLLSEDGKGEFGGLSNFEYLGVFYIGNYHKNKLLYFLSFCLAYFTPFLRREYYLVLRKK